jgi:hypothetical protein
MGVIHVISKYDLDNNAWKLANSKERFRSFAMANYVPIINSSNKDINYIFINYGCRVEDNSKDSININEKSFNVDKLIKYFSNSSNSNFIIHFVMLDADAPLIEQSKLLAKYIDDLATDSNVKTINMLGQSKCGAMNMYIPRFFNNSRSFDITNIYNVSTPYNGTLLASPLFFYPLVEELCKNKFGDNEFSNLLYKKTIKLYESISSNSHMDYDIAQEHGVPYEKNDKYDKNFIKYIFCKDNIEALNHVRSFTNFTTRIDKVAINHAYKTGDFTTIGLSLIDKWFFNQESDGLVKTSEQHLIENYMDIDSINLSASHMLTTSKDFYKILDLINLNIEKPFQRTR